MRGKSLIALSSVLALIFIGYHDLRGALRSTRSAACRRNAGPLKHKSL
ncbi:hypothetical protein ACQ3G7_06370 [Kosakonia oryzendophytica]